MAKMTLKKARAVADVCLNGGANQYTFQEVQQATSTLANAKAEDDIKQSEVMHARFPEFHDYCRKPA